MNKLSADEVIRHLDLAPHPEGGYFKETFRDALCNSEGRSSGTAIYYLLKAGEFSKWHRVDAAEIWHWYAGGPLELSVSGREGNIQQHILGTDFKAGQLPQIVVPLNVWQSAKPLGDWVLVGCTVAPGFEFSGFEMAKDGFLPRANGTRD